MRESREERREKLRAQIAVRWWNCDEDDRAGALWTWVDRFKSLARQRSQFDAVVDAIYLNRPITSQANSVSLLKRVDSSEVTLNFIASVVDTVTSKLGKRRPMPVVSADDARGKQKIFAKKASRVLRRKMGCSDVERLTPKVLRSAVQFGDGFACVVRDGGDVRIEEVPRGEIVVDPSDAKRGEPKTIARHYTAHRDTLLALYCDAVDVILAAPRSTEEYHFNDDGIVDSDTIEVVEAWRLTVGETCGRHTVAVRGAVVIDEEWDRKQLPFAVLHWRAPSVGMFGQGLVEEVAPVQQKIDDSFAQIAHNMEALGGVTIFLPRNGGINKTHLRGKGVRVVETDGPVPQFIAPSPVSPQLVAFLEWLIQRIYEIPGISQASAASKNPLGGNASGKALDTMYDIESDRFSHVESAYAQFRVDLGRLIVEEARAIAADEETEEQAPWIQKIDWTQCDIDGGEYNLVLEAVNFLPDSRAGRLSTVSEMGKAGIISDPEQIASLFDEPDIARANRSMLGPYKYAQNLADELLEGDKSIAELTPDPSISWLGNGKLRKYLQGIYADAIAEGEDEDVLDRFRDFFVLLTGMEKTASPPMPPAAPPMPGADPMMQPPPGLPPEAAPGMPAPMMQ